MIGTYEAPIWGRNGWLTELNDYAANDTRVRRRRPHAGRPQGPVPPTATSTRVPFYGESSMLMYRKDLFEQAGLTMPDNPTWTEVAEFARKLKTPRPRRHLPARPARLGRAARAARHRHQHVRRPLVRQDWNAQLTSPATAKAVDFYINLIKDAGEPGAPNAGFSECLTAYTQGQAAMWYDATVAAGSLEDAKVSQVVGKNGLRPGAGDGDPVVRLAVGVVAGDPEDREGPGRGVGVRLAGPPRRSTSGWSGERLGWERVPPGSRLSTYDIPSSSRPARAPPR